jgi:hypothetical protein
MTVTNPNVIISTQPTYVSIKQCNNGHKLTLTQGQLRFLPTCKGCGIQKLQSTYACITCNFDICPGCYNGQTKNISTNTNTNYNNNTNFNNNNNNINYVPTNTNNVPNYNNNSNINFVPSMNTNYNDIGFNNNTNTNSNFIPNYPSTNINTNYNNNINTGYIPNTNYNSNSNINTGYINPNINTNINTGYINTNNNTGFINPNTNINSGYIPNTNYNSNSNSNINLNTQSYSMTTQTKAIELKQCPSMHYLTLCDSTARYYPSCNICNKSNLKHSWTCFNCNYDMCLSCYDKDNTRPTNMVKVCNNRHLLCYTDKNSRPNVKCDKCKKKGFFNQYTCWVCNYDECINCYEGRKSNDCIIF